MNIPIFHIQGGEVSGSIDESARHAISKLAHFHYPATKRAAEYLIRMGEEPNNIRGIGCPSGDMIRSLDRTLDSDVVNSRGSGAHIDIEKPFLLALYHPTTTEFGGERAQMLELMHALNQARVPTVLLWPNIDAGADEISKAIRFYRTEREAQPWLRTITNLMPEHYLKLLSKAACAVGNSSSFVREASFMGTPVVLIGNRQSGREVAEHVMRVAPERDKIRDAIKHQLEHGRYTPSQCYGDGHVAKAMADQLAKVELYVQKRLAYAIAPEG